MRSKLVPTLAILVAAGSSACGSSEPPAPGSSGSAGAGGAGGVAGAGGSGGEAGTSGSLQGGGSSGAEGGSSAGSAQGSAGTNQGGSGGAAEFPYCTRTSGTLDSCAMEEAECLDVSPCTSGGCRRNRFLCESGTWMQDSSAEACGFPCNDGSAPTSCAIDDVSGLYQASHIKLSGDCSYDPGGLLPLEGGHLAVTTDTCELESAEVSSDRCNLEYFIVCQGGDVSAEWRYSVEQRNEDASVLVGTLLLDRTEAGTQCSAEYAVRFDKTQ